MSGSIAEPQPPMREHIKDVNTKAYYLLVALSFVYRASSASLLLKSALTLTALVAALPVQDYVESPRLLKFILALKVIFLAFAVALTLCWIWTAAATPLSAS
jgi:hypothetical protein